MIMMMMVFVELHLLHPVCQSLQLLPEAAQLPLLVPHLPLLSLPPGVLYCDGLVWLHLVVILVTKQHLKSKINMYIPPKLRLNFAGISYLEPEPIDYFEATYEGEASEEAHHAAHPGDLIREGHSGTSGDLQTGIVACAGILL